MDYDLIIDQEFHDLLEPHTAEEVERLRKNIIEDGRVIDPIVIWQGTKIIVDGMTRYRIAQEEAVPYKIEEMEFDSRADAKLWIYAHQLGRRNGDGLARSRWRAMLVQAKVDGSPTRPPMSRTSAVVQTAKEKEVSERQIWSDIAVHDVLTSLPDGARKIIQSGKIAARAEDILKIDKLPETQKLQVLDLLENMPEEPTAESVAFRSVEEVIDVVVEHQTGMGIKPAEISKVLEQEIAKVEKVIAELPGRLDKVSSLKKLNKSPWKERMQKSFAAFVAIWREQCRKSS